MGVLWNSQRHVPTHTKSEYPGPSMRWKSSKKGGKGSKWRKNINLLYLCTGMKNKIGGIPPKEEKSHPCITPTSSLLWSCSNLPRLNTNEMIPCIWFLGSLSPASSRFDACRYTASASTPPGPIHTYLISALIMQQSPKIKQRWDDPMHRILWIFEPCIIWVWCMHIYRLSLPPPPRPQFIPTSYLLWSCSNLPRLNSNEMIPCIWFLGSLSPASSRFDACQYTASASPTPAPDSHLPHICSDHAVISQD